MQFLVEFELNVPAGIPEVEVKKRVSAEAAVGAEGRVAGPAPVHADHGCFASFSAPDGNGWMLREVKTSLPGRVTGATCESAAELAQALERADAAHGRHEERTGEPDAEGASWHARYMSNEKSGEELLT